MHIITSFDVLGTFSSLPSSIRYPRARTFFVCLVFLVSRSSFHRLIILSARLLRSHLVCDFNDLDEAHLQASAFFFLFLMRGNLLCMVENRRCLFMNMFKCHLAFLMRTIFFFVCDFVERLSNILSRCCFP